MEKMAWMCVLGMLIGVGVCVGCDHEGLQKCYDEVQREYFDLQNRPELDFSSNICRLMETHVKCRNRALRDCTQGIIDANINELSANDEHYGCDSMRLFHVAATTVAVTTPTSTVTVTTSVSTVAVTTPTSTVAMTAPASIIAVTSPSPTVAVTTPPPPVAVTTPPPTVAVTTPKSTVAVTTPAPTVAVTTLASAVTMTTSAPVIVETTPTYTVAETTHAPTDSMTATMSTTVSMGTRGMVTAWMVILGIVVSFHVFY